MTAFKKNIAEQSCLWSVVKLINSPQANAGVKKRRKERALRDSAQASALCISTSGQRFLLCHLRCRLCNHDKFEAKMEPVSEYFVPLPFPNNFHRVLPLNTGDATNGARYSTYLALLDSRQGRTTILLLARCCWTSAAWRRRGSVKTADWDHWGRQWEWLVHANQTFGQNVIFCVTWLFRGALLSHAFPALSSAHFQCSISMECSHFCFWRSRKPPPQSPPPPPDS